MERDALIERLAEATPVRDADLATPTVIRLVEELGCSIAVGDGSGARPSTSDRPRRRRRWAALAAVALALAVATAALADEFSARTGWFGNPEHTEDDGASGSAPTLPTSAPSLARSSRARFRCRLESTGAPRSTIRLRRVASTRA